MCEDYARGLAPAEDGTPCGGRGTCEDGACACPSSEALCGARCVDTATDPRHCGACGHGCQGGACAASRCQPVVLAEGSWRAADIAVDAERAYWTTSSSGSVLSVPEEGGDVAVVALGVASQPWAIAVTEARVYWSDLSHGDLYRAPSAGGDEPAPFADQVEPLARPLVIDRFLWRDF